MLRYRTLFPPEINALSASPLLHIWNLIQSALMRLLLRRFFELELPKSRAEISVHVEHRLKSSLTVVRDKPATFKAGNKLQRSKDKGQSAGKFKLCLEPHGRIRSQYLTPPLATASMN